MARAMRYGTYLPNGPERAESCWISPTGNYWRVSESSHYGFAHERVGKTQGNPVEVLERRGWLHVSYTGLYIGQGCEVSPGQYDTLVAWARLCKGTGMARVASHGCLRLLGIDPTAD